MKGIVRLVVVVAIIAGVVLVVRRAMNANS